jgi:hypothetical protein
MQKTATRPTADDLNAALSKGRSVIVATCTKATEYGRQHAGWFSERNGSLYVKSGRNHDCLSMGDLLLVGIRIT